MTGSLRKAPSTETQKKKKVFTNSNPDKTCLANPANPVARFFYHLNQHDGLYMLDPHERYTLNSLAIIFTLLAGAYLSVFFIGFIDGLRSRLH